MECKQCGKPYIENKNIHKSTPENIKKFIKYIPSCDCSEKAIDKEIWDKWEADKKKAQSMRIKRLRDISIVGDDFYKATFSNAKSSKNIEKSKRYANRFIEDGTSEIGLFLLGEVGRGKTYAASCIANHLMANKKTVLAINIAAYLNRIREHGFDENKLLSEVSKVDLLIVDDFGVEKITDWVREKLFNLIDARYRAKKALIVTSNLSFDLLEKRLQDRGRVADRLRGMCLEMKFGGESMRKELALDKFKMFMAG